ncbi:MAG: hypothetical protein ACFB2W_24215 [Leptolyngbyaceae cyanobacterium]
MQDSTKTFLLLAILLLVLFPFAGLAPLMLLVVVGLLGMIVQLLGTLLVGAQDE